MPVKGQSWPGTSVCRTRVGIAITVLDCLRGQVELSALTVCSKYSKHKPMTEDKLTKRASAVFVEGMGAAFATSGVLSQLQGRIFGLLYLEPDSLSLGDIAIALDQSKSNVSINIRGLV